jgi:hypothetical protein
MFASPVLHSGHSSSEMTGEVCLQSKWPRVGRLYTHLHGLGWQGYVTKHVTNSYPEEV